MNWSFERHWNVQRSPLICLRTSGKRLRSAAITGDRMSRGYENRVESRDFYSVLSALLQNVPVNLLFLSCARRFRRSSFQKGGLSSSSIFQVEFVWLIQIKNDAELEVSSASLILRFDCRSEIIASFCRWLLPFPEFRRQSDRCDRLSDRKSRLCLRR